jgi:hypothetical protein
MSKVSEVLKEAGFDVEGFINQHKDPRVGIYLLVEKICLARYPKYMVIKQNTQKETIKKKFIVICLGL